MCSLTRIIAFVLTFSAATVRGNLAESYEVEPATTSANEVVAADSPAALLAPVEPGVMRAQLPAPPGPPRKCDDYRPCKPTNSGLDAAVSPAVRATCRPDDARDQSAALWAKSVASSLRLQHVLLQI
jgi:hypothetical protein